MSKATRSLSGASQKKFFRELFGSVDGLTPETAAALTAICEHQIAQVRVRLPFLDRGKTARPAPDKRKESKPSRPEKTSSTPQESTGAAFDPFAFSVVVAVTKEGREGLAKRLLAITSRDDLRALARAQHVAVPGGDATDDELRAAIVEGALQRIANRKAAAS
jgi:hypothetical protein